MSVDPDELIEVIVMADSVLTYTKADVREDWEAILAARRRVAEMEEDFAFVVHFLRRKGRGDWVPDEARELSVPAGVRGGKEKSAGRRGKAPAESGTWTSEIMAALADQPLGLLTSDIKDALEKGVMADKYRQNPNGYYNGISKLEKTEQVVRYKERYFTKPLMDAFLSKLRRGEVDDLPDNGGIRTVLDRLEDFVGQHPHGIAASDIAKALADTGMSSGGVYNNLSKAVMKNRLRREGKLYFPSKENSPRTGNASGGE